MTDKLKRYLDCNTYLRENIEIFKEEFIKFYGEEHRQEIEDKFSKVIFIGYQSPDALKQLLIKIKNTKSEELIKEVLESNNTNLTVNDIYDTYTLENIKITPLSDYKKVKESVFLGREGRLKKFQDDGYIEISSFVKGMTKEEYQEIITTKEISSKYSNLPNWLKNNLLFYSNTQTPEREYRKKVTKILPLLSKIDSTVTIDNFEEKIKDKKFVELDNILSSTEKALDEYNGYVSQFVEYENLIERIETMKTKLSEKYYKQLLQENLDLLPKESRTKAEEYLSSGKSYLLDNYTKLICGYTLTSPTILEYFTEDQQEKLDNPNTPTWIINDIKNNRIKYFKELGIDLGSDYENYLNNEEVKNAWPNIDRINIFLESKERILNDFNNEFYTSLPSHEKIRKELDAENLLDKDDSFNAHIYTQESGTFVNPNVTDKNGYYELLSLLVVNFNHYDDALDHNIVHELNHIFELSLEQVVGDEYTCLCGWDVMYARINQDKRQAVDTIHEEEKRPYELFNEIINEVIAQEICEQMHNNNVYVFNDKKDARVKHTTSYEHSLFLVKEFYDEFKEAIIKSRSNGNINIIYDEVGKENFDELNSLFSIFYENFNGFKIYRLIDSLKKNEDTEQTRIYYDLLDRKNAILDKMRKYNADNKHKEI